MKFLKHQQFEVLLKMNFSKTGLQKESIYKASRSGGKGGQNVNKVSSKVELLFDLHQSALFTDEQKELAASRLKSRFNKDGLLQVFCDQERSQYLNKEMAIEKLYLLLLNALVKPKARKATKPRKATIAARLEGKRMQSLKKESRRKNFGI